MFHSFAATCPSKVVRQMSYFLVIACTFRTFLEFVKDFLDELAPPPKLVANWSLLVSPSMAGVGASGVGYSARLPLRACSKVD